MEVVEFEATRAMSVVIHDGPFEMRGRMTFEAVNENQTTVTTNVEIPGMDESTDTTPLVSGIEQSGRNFKKLIESEL